MRLRALIWGAVLIAAAGLIGRWPATVAASVVWGVVVLRMMRPVRHLVQTARAVAAGRTDVRAPFDARGEAGEVARVLNELIREREQARSLAQAEHADLSAVLNAMREGVVALGPEGGVRVVNAAALKILGHVGPAATLADLIGDAELLTAANEVLRGGDPREVTFRGRRLRLSGGSHVVVLQDRTDEGRYEELRRQFAANVSHELKQPLTVLRAAIETLRESGPDEKALEIAARHADNLSRLVEDLLELSRLEAPEIVLRRSEVDLSEVAGRVAEDFSAAAAKNGVALTLAEASRVVVRADAGMVERAIANVVDNAVKFTPPGGRVTMRVRGTEVSVEDTGCGIPESDLPRVFERFYRVDPARSPGSGGAGLGLAIVKHIMELHGGDATIQSRVGEGTVVRLAFAKS